MLPSAPRHHGNGWKITLRDTLKNVLISIPTLSYYLEIFLYTEFSIYKASVFLWLVAGVVVVRSCRCWDSLLFTFFPSFIHFCQARPANTETSRHCLLRTHFRGNNSLLSRWPSHHLKTDAKPEPLCYEKLFKCFYLSLKSIIPKFYHAFLGFVYKKSYQTCTFRNRNSRRIDLKFNRIVYQPTTLNTRKGTKVTRNWDVK